jgi:hypothetical protein
MQQRAGAVVPKFNPVDSRREQGRRRLRDGLAVAVHRVHAGYSLALANYPSAVGIAPQAAEARIRHMRELAVRPAIEDFAGGLGGEGNPISVEYLREIDGDPIVHTLGNLLHRTVSLRLHPTMRVYAREEVQAIQEGLQKGRRELEARIARGEELQGMTWELDAQVIRSDTGASERVVAPLTHSEVERWYTQALTFDDPRCVTRIGIPPHRHQDMSTGAYVGAIGNLSYLYEYGRSVFGPQRGMRVAALFVQEGWGMTTPFSRKELEGVFERWRRYDTTKPPKQPSHYSMRCSRPFSGLVGRIGRL